MKQKTISFFLAFVILIANMNGVFAETNRLAQAASTIEEESVDVAASAIPLPPSLITAERNSETGSDSVTPVQAETAEAELESESVGHSEESENQPIAQVKADAPNDSSEINQLTETVEKQFVAEPAPVPFARKGMRAGGPATVVTSVRLQTVAKNPDGTDKTSYYSNEPFTIYAGLSISNETLNLDNSQMVVRIPAEFVSNADQIQASALENAVGPPQVIRVGEYWEVIYTFAQIPSGYVADTPITVRTDKGRTPDGFQMPVTIEVRDNAGDVYPAATDSIDFTVESAEPTFRKVVAEPSSWSTSSTGVVTVHSYRYTDANDRTFNGGLATDSTTRYLIGSPSDSAPAQDLKPIRFQFQLHSKEYLNNYGVRYYDTIEIEEKIPAGAVFFPALNPGWTEGVNAAGEAVYRYTAKPLESDMADLSKDSSFTVKDQGKYVELMLYFPGAQVRDENNRYINFTNTADITATPKGMAYTDQVVEQNDDIRFRLSATAPAGNFKVTKYSTTSRTDILIERQKEQSWTIDFVNLTPQNYEGIEFIDALDTGLSRNELYISGIKLNSFTDRVFTGSFTLTGITSDGREEILATDVGSTGFEMSFPKEKDFVSLSLKMNPGSVFYGLNQRTYTSADMIRGRVLTKFRNEEPKGITRNEYYYNRLTGNYREIVEAAGYKADSSGSGSLMLRPVERSQRIRKEVINRKSTPYQIGDEVTYEVAAYLGNIYPDEDITQFRVVDFLPDGMVYVPGSAKENSTTRDSNFRDFVTPGGKNGLIDSTNIEPEVVPNFRGSGKTALVWDFHPLLWADFTGSEKSVIYNSYMDGSTTSKYYFHGFTYRLKVDSFTGFGDQINEVYMSLDEANERPVFEYGTTKAVPDTLDINGNADTGELIAMDTASIAIAPPRELVGIKKVKGSEDQNFLGSTGIARSEKGDAAFYHLRMLNTRFSDVENLSLVDVFPFVGDYTLTTAVSNQLEKRNSEYSVAMTGPVTFVDPVSGAADTDQTGSRYMIYYSTSRPAADGSDAAAFYLSGGAGGWKTEAEIAGNWASVQAVKAVLKSGECLKAESADDFYVPIQIPRRFIR